MCVRFLVEHARATRGELTVDVNEQNTGAVDFYAACGFVVEGRSELDGTGRPYPLLRMRLARAAASDDGTASLIAAPDFSTTSSNRPR